MRPTWTEYFLKLAELASTRSTCVRANVGCVLVKDRRVLATGYNGSVPGATHCEDVGCLMVDGHCLRTVHSEMSALLSSAKYGTSVAGATCFVSHFPCFSCFKALASAGISKIIYQKVYLNGITREVYQAMLAMLDDRPGRSNGILKLEDATGVDFLSLAPKFEGDKVVGI